MSDKTRLITLGVVVFIFLVVNIIAGFYKWGASDQTSSQQVPKKDTVETISNQKEQNIKQTTVSDESKTPVPVEGISSDETISDSVKADYKAEIASLKSENDYLRSVQQKGSDIEAENIKLREKLQAALTTNQTLEKENENLRATEQKNREVAAGKSDIEDQIASYKNENSALENEIAALRRELNDKQTLINQNKQLTEQVQQCSAGRKNLENEISKLQNRAYKFQNVAAEYKQLQAKLEAYNGEIKTLKAQLDKIRAIVALDEKSN